MPKRKQRAVKGRRGQKSPPPGPYVCVDNVEEDNESNNGEELRQEQLEGLEIGDMEMIAKMGLSEEKELQKRRRKNGSDLGSEDLETIVRQGKRRRKEAVLDSDEGAASWEGVRSGGGGGEDEGEVRYLLPLKTRGGLVLQPPVPKTLNNAKCTVSDDEHLASDGDSEGGEMEAEPNTSEPSKPRGAGERLSTATLMARRAAVLEERKSAIADLASSLVEAPEENVAGLQRLLAFCSEREARVACTVRRMAMASLTAVFKDITPSYRIRELSEEEKTTKVSKDVRKLRVFEEALVSVYQQFLSLLNDYLSVGLGEGGLDGRQQVKRRKGNKVPLNSLDDGLTISPASMKDLGEVAVRCMCELIVSLPHFNFRNNTLAVIVPLMITKTLGGKISRLCVETVERLFRGDLTGEVSLEAVRLISKLVKSKSYNTRPAVLRSFLHLQLNSVDEPVGGSVRGGGRGGRDGRRRRRSGRADDVSSGSLLTRKQRKRLKAERDLERDLRETDATESREKKTNLQTEVLQLVFATYFRILKNSRHSPLLQPVLEGLAKFAHLISVDFFSDLMSVLHSLAETGGLTNRECMLCVLTAFEILSGQGEALNIDPRQFYVQLYGALLQLDTVSSNEDVVLALGCMDKMMRKQRQVSLQRVLGFVKRLSTVSLQLVPGACLAVLSTVRKCMLTYSQCGGLLDADGVCGGVFRPDIPDPEMSQASSSLLWEYTIHSHHYSPAVRAYATHILQGAPTQGKYALNPDIAKRSAEDLLGSLSVACQPLPLLFPSLPPPHPATKPNRKNKEYYYSDGGIKDDFILKAEQEANRVSEEVKHYSYNRPVHDRNTTLHPHTTNNVFY